jgi:hypothetical protein
MHGTYSVKYGSVEGWSLNCSFVRLLKQNCKANNRNGRDGLNFERCDKAITGEWHLSKHGGRWTLELYGGSRKYTKAVVPVYPMKTYRGNRGRAPLILNLGTSWRWVVNITPQPLYPPERDPIPILQEAGLSSGSCMCVSGKSRLHRVRTRDRLSRRPI